MGPSEVVWKVCLIDLPGPGVPHVRYALTKRLITEEPRTGTVKDKRARRDGERDTERAKGLGK